MTKSCYRRERKISGVPNPRAPTAATASATMSQTSPSLPPAGPLPVDGRALALVTVAAGVVETDGAVAATGVNDAAGVPAAVAAHV